MNIILDDIDIVPDWYADSFIAKTGSTKWERVGKAGADGNGESHEHDVLDALITEQLNARAEARKSRDFAKADAIRDALGAAGIAIEDGPQGSKWSLK